MISRYDWSPTQQNCILFVRFFQLMYDREISVTFTILTTNINFIINFQFSVPSFICIPVLCIHIWYLLFLPYNLWPYSLSSNVFGDQTTRRGSTVTGVNELKLQVKNFIIEYIEYIVFPIDFKTPSLKNVVVQFVWNSISI